ncbi:MAG TPA: GYDIA family GHMP kinase [Bacteroidales bacterium]|nr:GYDIA family GHMP kinase [Bacteroidales bacterium]HRW97238.1 GYDIA family GHMP kinase [Bacteroidales bacterium]
MKFYSRGKLLISGEYLVLKGAKALMVPLLKGQSLNIKKAAGTGSLEWKSLEYRKEWFTATFNTKLFEILNASDEVIARRLQVILRKARNFNPVFCRKELSFSATTDLEFDRNWGFGSSSTLIANIAQWAEVDSFILHNQVARGSGYDVVAATLNQPAYFTLLDDTCSVEKVNFNPGFRDQIYFIFLGRKQDSAKVVDRFLKSKKQYRVEMRTISELSQHMAKAKTLGDFEFYLREHDTLMSALLKQPRLKDSRFNDLNGEIKPLGAWGGDFAMMTWHDAKEDLAKYLEDKGIQTFFGFDELIKTK